MHNENDVHKGKLFSTENDKLNQDWMSNALIHVFGFECYGSG